MRNGRYVVPELLPRTYIHISITRRIENIEDCESPHISLGDVNKERKLLNSLLQKCSYIDVYISGILIENSKFSMLTLCPRL